MVKLRHQNIFKIYPNEEIVLVSNDRNYKYLYVYIKDFNDTEQRNLSLDGYVNGTLNFYFNGLILCTLNMHKMNCLLNAHKLFVGGHYIEYYGQIDARFKIKTIKPLQWIVVHSRLPQSFNDNFVYATVNNVVYVFDNDSNVYKWSNFEFAWHKSKSN